MCGICGIIEFAERRVDEETLVSMRDAMMHRGPDDKGIRISSDGRVGLGHRRLSIIDLSAHGRQPMSNEDDAIWVVCNGEIYNHHELRDGLEAAGHVFKSHSDAEVIVHLYEEKGISCVGDLRGMFAFGLWDERKSTLYLVRDRIGIKPLYYAKVGSRIIFASEIKSLLMHPNVRREVNEEAFYHYLSFSATPAPATLFKGIMKLPNGCLLKVTTSGSMTEERYWDVLDQLKPMKDASEEEAADAIISELRTSVQIHKASDVPVGLFLSGGVDSSINAVLLSECGGKPLKTFSMAYDSDYKDYPSELTSARKIVKLTGAQPHEIILGVDDIIGCLEEMVYHQDEPIADPVCVPFYYLSKLARDNGVIVCQAGEGSDELFCGYTWWGRILPLERLNMVPAPRFLKNIWLDLLRKAGGFHGIPEDYISKFKEGKPVFWGGNEEFTETEKKMLLSPRLRERFKGYSSYEVIKPIRERFEKKTWEMKPLAWMTYLDLNIRLPELLMMRIDKMGMAVSVEGRVPFLDHKFVELVMSIPDDVKTKGGELKHILKKSLRGIIPDEIIERPKQGFWMPVHEWLSGKLGEYTERKTLEFTERTDYFDVEYLKGLIASKDDRLWLILNFILWHEMWIEKKVVI